jgi:translation initiation factor 1
MGSESKGVWGAEGGRRPTSLASAAIENLNVGLDAFDEKKSQQKVHIRVAQRSGRKNITTVQGLDDDLDVAKICRALKKILACNGSVSKTKDMGDVIQLQGDQREAVRDFLFQMKIYNPKEDRVVVHGS